MIEYKEAIVLFLLHWLFDCFVTITSLSYVSHYIHPSFLNMNTASNDVVPQQATPTTVLRPPRSPKNSKSVSALKKSAPPEKRLRQTCTKCPQNLHDWIYHSTSQRMYLVQCEELASDWQAQEIPPSCDFVMAGLTGNIYTVQIANVPTCTCPDFLRKQDLCKHIFFVLLKCIGIEDNLFLLYQKVFLNSKSRNYSSKWNSVVREAPSKHPQLCVPLTKSVLEVVGQLAQKITMMKMMGPSSESLLRLMQTVPFVLILWRKVLWFFVTVHVGQTFTLVVFNAGSHKLPITTAQIVDNLGLIQTHHWGESTQVMKGTWTSEI